MITTQVEQIKAATERAFAPEFKSGALYQLGVYNRRYIAGTTIWSQHAWGNAWDIGIARGHRPELGDKVVEFLRNQDRAGTLRVGTILWQVRDHYDHIHVEGDPKRTGTPPTRVTDREDEQVIARGDRGNAVALFQKCLNNFKPFGLEVDGIFGPKTEEAVKGYQAAADIETTGQIDGVTAGLLLRYES